MQTTNTSFEAGRGADRLALLIATLRTASQALDEMWREAISGGDASRLIELGDASYGLHLALVALDDAESERRSLVS